VTPPPTRYSQPGWQVTEWFAKWCYIGVILHHKYLAGEQSMARQSISITDPNSEWLKLKVDVEGEYRSNSEAVNDLIRKAREIEYVRARLIQAEQSGFSTKTADEILAQSKDELRKSGEL